MTYPHLAQINPETMHHAFIVEGDVATSLEYVFEFTYKSFGMDKHHADVIFIDRTQGSFGVDDVEDVIQINSRKPVIGHRKVIILALSTISHQAQNSLLKVLEEPRPGTIIFILTRTAGIFLPTILSRVQVLRDISGAAAVSKGSTKNSAITPAEQKHISKTLSAAAFVEHDITSRLRQVKEILKMKDDEEIGDEEIFDFLTNIEREACALTSGGRKGDEKNVDKKRFVAAEVFTRVGDFVRDPSSSKKMLLEYVALRLPDFSV